MIDEQKINDLEEMVIEWHAACEANACYKCEYEPYCYPDEVIGILRSVLEPKAGDKGYLEKKYNKLFDYWNEKYPDEMGECMKSLSKDEVNLSYPDVKI